MEIDIQRSLKILVERHRRFCKYEKSEITKDYLKFTRGNEEHIYKYKIEDNKLVFLDESEEYRFKVIKNVFRGLM